MMTAFLLGAGFNCDAKREAGRIPGMSQYGEYEIKCDYPLVADLLRTCFGRNSLGVGETIEELFANAIQERNYAPVRALYDALMKADYYIPRLLINGSHPRNCYARFFERFQESHFLTFNYDSLPEVFLFHRGDWYPHDGYGVPVEVEGGGNLKSRRSKSLVLHLHGSLCIYTCSFDLILAPGSITQWVVPKERPAYIFDPHTIGLVFRPYRRMPPQPTGYVEIEHRVIAPIPNKAQGPQQEFIKAIHAQALDVLRSSNNIIAIGYRFNPLDRISYHHLLQVASQGKQTRIVLVCPDAEPLRNQLSVVYPGIEWVAVTTTFKEWVDAEFPEVTSS